MTNDEFHRILTTFADSPESIDLTKGHLMVQVLDEVIEADISQRDGSIFVTEDDAQMSGFRWLVRRIAKIPLLAERILAYTPEITDFVAPEGILIDQLEAGGGDEGVDSPDVADTVLSVLDRRPAGTSSVLYLTSDAGEGKTTLINHVARRQAESYKANMTDWLLVPITLGGRPFLRFDDIIVGSLANRLRFQFFYYDSFLELVRLGVLIPAFDGFEEMFIESSSGEALSALGGLLESLDSKGSALISARKAYFDYKGFSNRAKLFDAIGSNSASFASLAIKRWGYEQFVDYASKRNIPDGHRIYTDVENRLSSDHSLLTRAVLVKRLLDVAKTSGDRANLLARIGQAPHEYFFQFVDAIIEREVKEKWIDRSGDLAKPLITTSEHHILLSMIAQELWIASSNSISGDVLEVISDMFSESKNKPPIVSRQIKERIKQHALLTSSVGSPSSFMFDHEEFKNFFLGQAIGRCILEQSESDLRSVLRAAPLPAQTYDSAVQNLQTSKVDVLRVAKDLQRLSQADMSSSFIRENCGGLLIRLFDGYSPKAIEVVGVSFPQECLVNRSLSGIKFKDCYFQSTALFGSKLEETFFEACRFDRVDLSTDARISKVIVSNCEISSVVEAGSDHRIFDPRAVLNALANAGFTVLDLNVESEISSTVTVDDEFELFERMMRYFLRSTLLSDNVLRLRLGSRASYFLKNVLPQLTKKNLIVEVPNTGKSNQRLYRLGVPMREIDQAMAKSLGSFDEFLKCFDTMMTDSPEP